MKISSFMIGLVVISLIMALFNIFFAGINEGYHSPSYDEGSMEAYNKLDDITAQTEDIKAEVTAIKEKPSILDVIGGFFSSGYKALKLTYTSFDTFDCMTNQALTDANLGKTGQYLKTAIGGIVIVLIFVGVVISAILKYGV